LDQKQSEWPKKPVSGDPGNKEKKQDTPKQENLQQEKTSQPDEETGDQSQTPTWLTQMTQRSWWTKKKAGIAAAVLAVCVAGVGLTAFELSAPEQMAVDKNQPIYLTVKPGMAASDLREQLYVRGVVNDRLALWWDMKVKGYDGKIQTGTYAFDPGSEPQEVVRKLVTGETSVIKFTIPEGFGVQDIAKRLAAAGLADEKTFLAEAKDFVPYDYVGRHPNTRYACEGFLFPDTYELRGNEDNVTIMKMMARDFDERFTPEMRALAQSQGLSIYQVVTLASLVEKEARYAEDRPIIAQVFLKRLRIGMPLQSDTTLQYLLNEPKEDVTIADTQMESPYNTYQNMGLPPGPIASPGMAAIDAVLHPASTDYLYFVADRQGHNHYSMTYEEHQAIVEQVR